METRDSAISLVLTRLIGRYHAMRQKHGEYSIDGSLITNRERLAALGEEFGEVCRALTYDRDHAGNLREELIDLANVAVTWAASLPESPGQSGMQDGAE